MTEATVTAEHNQQLSDDQLRALAYHHKGHYERALAVKKKADADFKNTTKRAIADGVPVDRIKLLISLEEEGGEEKLREELREKCITAQWAGVPIGGQMDWLDEPDRTPLLERAYAEGKIAGMKGETCTGDPYDGEAAQERIRGWHDGQEVLFSTLDLTKARRVAEEAEPAEKEAQPKRRGGPKGAKNKAKNGSDEESASNDGDPFEGEATGAEATA